MASSGALSRAEVQPSPIPAVLVENCGAPAVASARVPEVARQWAWGPAVANTTKSSRGSAWLQLLLLQPTRCCSPSTQLMRARAGTGGGGRVASLDRPLPRSSSFILTTASKTRKQ